MQTTYRYLDKCFQRTSTCKLNAKFIAIFGYLRLNETKRTGLSTSLFFIFL
nr:MAG TPA: hypothetical protein [Caudoviricetes sp.]